MPLLPAVIGIVFNADRTQVLLVKRRDVPVWVLPGGGIDTLESAEIALQREIEEETGYSINIVRQCAEYYPINRLSSLTSVFICHIQSGQMRLSEETAEVAFYGLDQLPSGFFPPHALWLKEALAHSFFVKRPLIEVNYVALCKYFICHPWQVLRFAWTRWIKS